MKTALLITIIKIHFVSDEIKESWDHCYMRKPALYPTHSFDAVKVVQEKVTKLILLPLWFYGEEYIKSLIVTPFISNVEI